MYRIKKYQYKFSYYKREGEFPQSHKRHSFTPRYKAYNVDTGHLVMEVPGYTRKIEPVNEGERNYKKQSFNISANYQVDNIRYVLCGFTIDYGWYDDFSLMNTELPASDKRPHVE